MARTSCPGRPSFSKPLKPPHAAYHAAGGKLARDVAFGGFERVGQKCDFEQYARNAEEDEAEQGGEETAAVV